MSGPLRSPSLAIVNLGCPKNQVEAEQMVASFEAAGCRYEPDTLQSDIVLVNTCGFIGPAKEESIETVLSYLELKKERPELKVIVSGCLFERYDRELSSELPEVDGWLRLPTPAQVRSVVEELGFQPPSRDVPVRYGRPVLLNEPGTAYLKISEGCDRPCSFCAIPGIKGAMRSRPVAALVEEARRLAIDHRVHEVNLIAQDPAAYGRDLRDGTDLLTLLEALARVEEVRWFRLLYMFPFGLKEAHLELLGSSPRFCPYLDMPLQHAHRDVLLRMRRPAGRERYMEHLDEIRRRWPGVAIRSTFLVGHPGETDAHFDTLCDFVREAGFQWAGVFEYSEEEGTMSATMEGAVDPEIAAERAERLRAVFEESRDMAPFRLGETREALVVERGDGFLACRTATEAPEIDGAVFIPDDGSTGPGEMIRVRVDAAEGFDFTGERAGGALLAGPCAPPVGGLRAEV